MQELTLKVKRLNNLAIMPLKGDEDDAGWDLFATEDVFIYRGDVKKVHTGIALGIPKGYRVKLRSRSGLASKGLTVLGGVIDRSYTGELIVCLACVKTCTKEELEEFGPCYEPESYYYINKGDRIAQFVLEEDPEFVTLLEVDELEETNRGSKNFGSSGK